MQTSRTLVWDLPTRTFHWLLALAFLGAFMTAEVEGLETLHLLLGYTVAVLVAFRLLWGLIGTRYARFSSFTLSPSAALDYARSLVGPAPRHFLGHNPLGSWSVVVTLTTLALVVSTGVATLFAADHKLLEELHEGIAAAALALAAVHVAAVALSSFLHRENLARAMITGYKRGAVDESAGGARPLAAIILIGLVAVLWSGIVPIPGVVDRAGVMASQAVHHGHGRGHDHDDD